MSALRFPYGLELAHDLAPAAWVREALRDWPRGRPFIVSDLVPPVFETFARVLHRPHRPGDEREPTGTWIELAGEVGVPFGAETRWEDLERRAPAGSAGNRWSLRPGVLSLTEATRLGALVEDETSTPETCWFAMWSSWVSHGAPLVRVRGPFPDARIWWRSVIRERQERREMRRLSTFQILGSSGRVCLLFGGRVTDVDRFALDGLFHSPALWWPADRAWFVHTEVDGTSTYIGGSQAMIGRLVRDQILEAFEVNADDLARL